jgi:uncharacterized protein
VPADPSIERVARVVSVAHRHLQERRQELNDLNVFPVADGDTGDNMMGTIEAVLDGLDSLRSSALAAVDRNYIVQTVAHSALMGARGNSGVILSQIVRGAAEVLTTRRGDLIGPRLVRDALKRAADAAWESVGDPQEGTMLTVARVIHEAVAERVRKLESGAQEVKVTEAGQEALLADLLRPAVEAGQAAVDRTPQQLDVLAEAGVVDAGAYGLVVMLAGVVAGLDGEEGGPSPVPHQSAPPLERLLHADSRYRYCTSFILTGRGLDPPAIVPGLEELGDSVAVVGDETMLKVHVHTDRPERARDICADHGAVDQFEFTDMRAQIARRGARLGGADDSRTGIVAVVSGDGIAELFRAEGARVVDGGPTLNPAIGDLITAIEELPADEVIVLPNSPNVVMAAEEAARVADRPARVIDTASQQAGLLALIGGFDAAVPAGGNARRIEGELEAITTGLVAEADKDDAGGRYRRGHAVGFAGAELVAWGDPADTLGAVVSRLSEEAEIVTLLEGAGAPASASSLEFELRNGAEVEILAGGQPTYWWLIAAQ